MQRVAYAGRGAQKSREDKKKLMGDEGRRTGVVVK
jgi:hypothetical protein